MELTAAFLALFIVAVWRLGRRRRSNPFGPLPGVADAPVEARPMATWRQSDDGLAGYWLDLPSEVASHGDETSAPTTPVAERGVERSP